MHKTLFIVALVLAVIGALNWGLSSMKNKSGQSLNLVHNLLGSKDASGKVIADCSANWNKKEKTVYTLVAIAGVVALFGGLKMAGKRY
jgi:uncharacterized membrane protein YuzA (DUF378 family)